MLKHSSKSLCIFAFFAICMLVAAALQPAIARPAETTLRLDSKPAPSSITPATASALSALGQMRAAANQQQSFEIDVDALQNATPLTNRTDTDGDGLYDSVEWILGTDLNNSDSDFDLLTDSYEARNNLDPLEPDSNGDGLSDYFEVTNVSSLDCDDDGFPNQWDFDNDGDGVTDTLDLSPFSKSSTSESFNFDIKTNGHPTYINFQLRPDNPDNMMLPLRTWDWPYDCKGTMQDLDNSTDDIQIIPMLELTLNQVPAQSEVTDYGIGIFADRAYVPLAQVQSRGADVALGGKMFYPASQPLDIRGNASLIWLVKAKTDRMENGTILSENTTLVKYNERFTLTGFSVEESYGNDVGLFYSDDINQTIGANFLLAYAFLRNNQTLVYDMPAELANHNVSITSSIKSFSHQDLALLNITSRMTPAALNSLPENQILPVIAAFASNFTKTELSEIDSHSCILGNNLSVDLRSEPMITMKMLKTSWYNTTTQEVLETKAVMAEMQEWGESIGLEEDTLSSMMLLALAWNVGESTVPRIGDDLTDFKAYEKPFVASLVETSVSTAFKVVSVINDLIGYVVTGKYLFTAFKTVKAEWFGLLSTWETLGKAFKAVADTSTKLTKVLNAVTIILSVVGLVLDIGFALLGFFLISMSEGWSATGTFQGFLYAAIMSLYAICLFLIGLIFFLIGMLGPVGLIIAIIGGIILGVIGLIDMILGFFGIGFSDLILWLVSQLHKTYMRTNVGLDMLNTSV
ncbi:MAG: hypothetical protein JW878_05955, partial [Methanomicrobia archaeon]|nr:hypothetical protein [Methanomicrobia archaeon]